jgi:hypothetical protein
VVLSRQENYNPNPEEVGPGGDAGGALVAKSVEVKKGIILTWGNFPPSNFS